MSSIKTWSTPVSSEEKKSIPCNLCGGQKFRPSLSCEGFSYVRCAACGLVQMNPQPLEQEIKRRYGAAADAKAGNSYGEDYLAYELANEEPFLNLQLLALRDAGFDEIEKDLGHRIKRISTNGIRNNSLDNNSRSFVSFDDENSSSSQCYAKPKVLDIGCATGSLLARLRERGWETVGVEISKPQAEYGRRKRGLDIRDLPLEGNKFPSGHFNVVLASNLIEHINDPAGLAGEVHRILVPGGYFFVSTPNISGFQARLFGGRWRSAIFDHLYLFSAKTLSRLLGEKGFTIEKTATWGGLAAGTAPVPVKRVFDKAAKRFGFGDMMIMRAKKGAV